MHPTKVLLLLITKGFPPPEGAHHAVLVQNNKLTLIIHVDGAFVHVILEDEDLERPPGDIFLDVTNLIAAHRAEQAQRKLDS